MSMQITPFARLSAHIQSLCHEVGRPPEEITIIAMSKGRGWEKIRPLIEKDGCLNFGEIRVQEATRKWQAYPQLKHIRLHMAGRLQSNKITVESLELFHSIHTLDRPSLVQALAPFQARGVRLPQLFVQVNIGGEMQKGGVFPQELTSFLKLCGHASLNIAGLMCLPPKGKVAAPYFEQLRLMAHDHGLSLLSMGMSSDYEDAIRQGATHVRIGTALFEPASQLLL